MILIGGKKNHYNYTSNTWAGFPLNFLRVRSNRWKTDPAQSAAWITEMLENLLTHIEDGIIRVDTLHMMGETNQFDSRRKTKVVKTIRDESLNLGPFIITPFQFANKVLLHWASIGDECGGRWDLIPSRIKNLKRHCASTIHIYSPVNNKREK